MINRIRARPTNIKRLSPDQNHSTRPDVKKNAPKALFRGQGDSSTK
jgi:hypothetical protein